MSTLKVDNIRDNGTGFNDVVSFQNANGTENGRLCRAFVNFDGTGAVAIRANFNVNSITDNGTGDYTVNFANALSDANYTVAAILGDSGTGNSGMKIFTTGNNFSTDPVSMTSSGIRLGATNADIKTPCVTIFR